MHLRLVLHCDWPLLAGILLQSYPEELAEVFDTDDGCYLSRSISDYNSGT